MLEPRRVIIGVFLVLLLPLWIFFGWATGFIQIGAEQKIRGHTPELELPSRRARDVLRLCLLKNHSGRLSLVSTKSPIGAPQTVRLRNRALHIVIDISSDRERGSIVRVYKFGDASLSPVHRLAIESCISSSAPPGVS